MSIALEVESALSYGGLFSQPACLNDAKAWLAAEERRLGILAQTLQRAEASGDPHAVAPHKAAFEDSQARVKWLTTLTAELTAHNERIAPMKFSWAAWIAEPLGYIFKR